MRAVELFFSIIPENIYATLFFSGIVLNKKFLYFRFPDI